MIARVASLPFKFPALSIALAALIALPIASRAEELLPDKTVDKPIPSLTVLDMQGQQHSYQASSGGVTVIIFFSTRCPMSNAFNYRRNQLYHDYSNRVRFLVVDSNANESLDEIRTYGKDAQFDFPVYRDLDNKAADLLGARNTTESFVLDASGAVRYRGYIEDSPNPTRTTNQGLRLAIEAVLSGRPVATPETRGRGCAIRRLHPQE